MAATRFNDVIYCHGPFTTWKQNLKNVKTMANLLITLIASWTLKPVLHHLPPSEGTDTLSSVLNPVGQMFC